MWVAMSSVPPWIWCCYGGPQSGATTDWLLPALPIMVRVQQTNSKITGSNTRAWYTLHQNGRLDGVKINAVLDKVAPIPVKPISIVCISWRWIQQPALNQLKKMLKVTHPSSFSQFSKPLYGWPMSTAQLRDKRFSWSVSWSPNDTPRKQVMFGSIPVNRMEIKPMVFYAANA